MQNEELVQARADTEAVLRQYTDLYDFAPVGYFTLGQDGMINQVNLAGAALLGVERGKLLKRRLGVFVPAQSLKTLNAFLDKVFSSEKNEVCEIELSKAGSAPLWAHIEAATDSGEHETCRAAVVDITVRKQAEEEIQRLNAELEQRVILRTGQLESANKELQAFSYSVSHDLRAPLRGIDGWSLALLEDYGSQLDGQAKTYLERVRSETQHMGRLIDDLLELSRQTSAELSIKRVDLSAIASTIAGQLQQAQPERQVEFVIQAGLNANGDGRLLEIALTNLLDNAFKFTGKTPRARIEFGQTEINGQRAFFVGDNGAGFDMAFAKKLFGAFQRMHKASDFPGTGVGLTIVQRIVHRHGGRIWAEAAVNQGATFFFTLEEIP
jgi:PAS domain S-box-containing protein